MVSYKQIAVLLGVCVVLVAGLSYWAGLDSKGNQLTLQEDAAPLDSPFTPKELDITKPNDTNSMNPVAVLETNKGTVEIELFKDTMPITAGNFEKLVREGYYDGIKFHRVIDGFMIQGGDPLTKDASRVREWGTGGPGYAIADEHVVGELLTNTRGTISMANSGPNSGGSQFFINFVDNTNLDFDKQPLSSAHPVFGRVIAGMDVVDAIGKVPVTPGNNQPLEAIIISKATIK
ncbi:peptidylprolyl isomerase [Patescibacteria group bacterium]|nr:peptidylprolyl isomerase [Patescibacteria group bacterium]